MEHVTSRQAVIENPGLELGDLKGWYKHWATRSAKVIKDPTIGEYVAMIGLENGQCFQEVIILPVSVPRGTSC